MRKEELEQEATEYVQKLGVKDFIAKPKEIVAYFGYLAGAESREKRIEELEAQIGQLSETISELLSFEGNLDPYMYECDDAQQGELLKPFNKAKELLKKYECKKCKGEGIIFTKKYHNKITCPVCNGEGFIFNKEMKEK